MKKQVSLAGWGLLRVVPLEGHAAGAAAGSFEDIYWEPRWVALESGSLLWYIDEMQVFPEEMVALVEPCVETLRRLEHGEVILIIKGENALGQGVAVELGVPADEALFWRRAIDLHVDTLLKMGAVVSLADLTMDDVVAGGDGVDGAALASSIRIGVRGESFTLNVTAEDDISAIATEFVEKNGLRKELEITVERELYKAQIRGAVLRENKLKKQISQVRRRVGDVALAEGRAARAEQHATALAASLQAIELMVPQIHSQLDEAKRKVAERDWEIKELHKQLADEDALIHRLAKESDDIADSLCDQQAEARRVREERDALEEERNALERELQDLLDNPEQQEQLRENNGPGAGAASVAGLVNPAAGAAAAAAAAAATPDAASLNQLRRSNVALKQQLLEQNEEMKRLQLDLKAALLGSKTAAIKGAKAASATMAPPPPPRAHGTTPSLEQQYKRKITTLEEKIKQLGGSLKASDEGRALLQVRVDEANATAHHAQKQLRASQEELSRATHELKDLRVQSSVRNYDALTAENRSLRDEVIRFRGEVLRLQARIDEVQASAVQAVQSLQLLGSGVGGVVGGGGASPTLSRTSSFRQSAAAAFSPPPSPSHSPSASRRGGLVDEDRAAAASPEAAAFLDLSSSSSARFARGQPPQSPSAPHPRQTQDLRVELAQAASASASASASPGVRVVWEPTIDVASARISPIVEDRLLHNIYRRYVGDATPHMGSTTLMTLSKFGRFTKDFGISIIAKGGAFQPPFLVNGEIDVIFLNATQVIPDNNDLPDRAPRAFGVRAGAGDERQYKRSTVGAAGAAPVISAGQFIAAVRVLACQLYANVIEHETGTVLECLPPRQRQTAARAVMDVLLKKKIVPTAEKLGLVPWPLIHLDQTMTVLASFPDTADNLSQNFPLIFSWFEHYCGTGSGVADVISYKNLSRFAHDFGVVPYLLKEPQLFRSVSQFA